MSERPPRVLHVGKYLPPVPGGIETYLGDLLRVSMRHGMPVGAIVHERKGYPKPNPDDFGGAKIYSVPTYGQLLYAPVAPNFPWRLRQAIRDFKPDILHLHMPNTSVFAALLLPQARRIPWVVHWHADVDVTAVGTALRIAYIGYRLFERRVLHRSQRIFVSSRQYLQASQALGQHLEKCNVVPLGVDPVRLGRVSDDDRMAARLLWPRVSGPKILFVGRLAFYKGVEFLLAAMTDLNEGTLIVVGDGPNRASLEQCVVKKNLSSRVVFLGTVASETLHALYAAADLLVLPSVDRSESFGLVLLEGAFFGLPVIASLVPGSGVANAAASGGKFQLVEPRNAFELCEALERSVDLKRSVVPPLFHSYEKPFLKVIRRYQGILREER